MMSKSNVQITNESVNGTEQLLNTPKTVQYFDDRFYRVELEEGNVQYLPSVTTVLGVTTKWFLSRWRGDIGNREADLRVAEGADRGSRLHHACEAKIKYGDKARIIYQPRYQPVYSQAQIEEMQKEFGHRLHIIRDQGEMMDCWKMMQCFQELKAECVATELIVWDIENKVAGSLDYLWKIEEGDYMVAGSKPLHLPAGLYVVDLKTGKFLDDDPKTQVAKYREMALRMREFGLDIEDIVGGLIVHTQATTKKGIPGLNVKHYTGEELDEESRYFNDHLLPVWRKKNPDFNPQVFDMPTVL